MSYRSFGWEKLLFSARHTVDTFLAFAILCVVTGWHLCRHFVGVSRCVLCVFDDRFVVFLEQRRDVRCKRLDDVVQHAEFRQMLDLDACATILRTGHCATREKQEKPTDAFDHVVYFLRRWVTPCHPVLH